MRLLHSSSMADRRISELPNELLDNIFEFLTGDKQTLQSCSLTCKSLAYPSQCHLHRSVEVAMCCGYRFPKPSNLRPPQENRYSEPRVAQMVRKLVIREVICTMSCRGIIPEDQWSIVTHMNNVQSLRIQRWSHILRPEEIHRLLSQFRGLSHLSFRWSLISATTLISFFTQSPHLVSFEGFGFKLNTDSPPISEDWEPVPNLGSHLRHIGLGNLDHSTATQIATFFSLISLPEEIEMHISILETGVNEILEKLAPSVAILTLESAYRVPHADHPLL